MAHQARLVIGNNLDERSLLKKDLSNKSYKVLKCSYEFSKPVQENGQPCGHAAGGKIRLLLETSGNDDTLFSNWMLDTIRCEDGAIAFEVAKNARKNLFFKNAYCIYFGEDFDTQCDEQMLTEIHLSAEEISFGSGLRYYNNILDEKE
jgi:hypothetical protein